MAGTGTHIENKRLRLIICECDVTGLDEHSAVVFGSINADSVGRRFLVVLARDRQVIFSVGADNFRADHCKEAESLSRKTSLAGDFYSVGKFI